MPAAAGEQHRCTSEPRNQGSDLSQGLSRVPKGSHGLPRAPAVGIRGFSPVGLWFVVHSIIIIMVQLCSCSLDGAGFILLAGLPFDTCDLMLER
jgi:hypothetical protein